jgi:hypothetical protein
MASQATTNLGSQATNDVTTVPRAKALGSQTALQSKWVGLVFLNNRIRTRVYQHETFDSFFKRVRILRTFVTPTDEFLISCR